MQKDLPTMAQRCKYYDDYKTKRAPINSISTYIPIPATHSVTFRDDRGEFKFSRPFLPSSEPVSLLSCLMIEYNI